MVTMKYITLLLLAVTVFILGLNPYREYPKDNFEASGITKKSQLQMSYNRLINGQSFTGRAGLYKTIYKRDRAAAGAKFTYKSRKANKCVI